MSTIKLVLSDLHLADGTEIFECFEGRQQAAFEGLLRTVSQANAPFGQAESLELIINGDCFDFLVTQPYVTQRRIDAATAVQKIEKIIAAHGPFFVVLRSFIDLPGCSLTFTVGNHDLELFFAPVREHICQAITGKPEDPRVSFCLERSYRPLPDVYIEHGNHFDFWNYTREGLWDERGNALTANPASITIPIGSWFYERVMYLISLRYPYIDHFEPSMSQTRKIALLSLLDPELVQDLARRAMEMMSQSRVPLANLQPGEERNPVRLFEEAMQDFVAFRQDLSGQRADWQDQENEAPASTQEMMEFMMVHDSLSQPLIEAIAAICTPDAGQVGDEVTHGMQAILKDDSTLRYSLAGHTHIACIEPLNQGQQVYLNTAGWAVRFALPARGEVTPELVEWLCHPDWRRVPLREVTQLVFALITASDNGPASARLCAWEGGLHGSYRVLA